MDLKIYAQTYPTDKLIKITDKLNLIQDMKMKRIKKKVYVILINYSNKNMFTFNHKTLHTKKFV